MTVRLARSLPAASLLLASTFALACSDVGTHSLAIEGSERVIEGVSTADGWTVNFDRFVVVVHNPGLIERIDNQPAWVREPGVTVWDVTQPLAQGEALSRHIRATRYDGADFRIAPASASGYEPAAGNVDRKVLAAARAEDWSLHVVGSASNGSSTLSFDWTLASNHFYRCELSGDAVVELDADGDETTVIEILGEALLGADFQPLADADADGDGLITQAELESAGLWAAIESAKLGGVRGVGACPVVDE